ncbi:MAG TPA: SDR family oxidoreductase [Trueperaceae bacterium]|nr:SDR family oxidoreductase [Trueperaceae bacterium]
MSQEAARAPAVVTGASSGIGRALALALGKRGWSLLLAARDADRLEAVRRAVEELGGTARARALDVTDDAAVDAWVAGYADRPEGVAALVHSAGMVHLGSVAETDVAMLDAHYAVNLRAPYRLTRALLPALERARGQVVFINSGAGLHANASWSAYAASKFGLRALADSLRQEVASRGVRVTTVYPGRTATPMQAHVHEQEGRGYDPAAFVRPEDVGEQVAGLLSVAPPSVVTELVIRPG